MCDSVLPMFTLCGCGGVCVWWCKRIGHMRSLSHAMHMYTDDRAVESATVGVRDSVCRLISRIPFGALIGRRSALRQCVD